MSSEPSFDGDNEKRKRISTGLLINCPQNLKLAIQSVYEFGFQFIITQITHPNYARDALKPPLAIGRTDRILQSHEWGRFIVAELTENASVDSELEHVRLRSAALFRQELAFAAHLGVPVVKFTLTQARNPQLGRLVNQLLTAGSAPTIWVTLPLAHPSQHSPLCTDEKHDSWEWWNDFRTYCNYDKHLGVALELPRAEHIPGEAVLRRWIGEPVKALIVSTKLFITNAFGKPVLPRLHQELLQRFMAIDVQYVLKTDEIGADLSLYTKYLYYLGKKLYDGAARQEFVRTCEDYLQNPLQPLTEHLETTIYEVFEMDQIKYTTYQNAIQKAVEDVPRDVPTPVVMVVGAGRGPLVQAALNVGYILHREIKVYAVEKNPYAVNTLIDRVKNEWGERVTLINGDMRVYEPPEKADVLVSELLGSFGDNELSPECLDGAQRFLKRGGVSIPCSYTSYLAPLQSIKIFNEIRSNRTPDKTLRTCYETPYVIHLVNYYQIAPPQALFKFEHPNWNEVIVNERYKRLKFNCSQNCVLTGFVGFFDTVLYKDVMLSIHPDTHTHEMVSWFPIVFPLNEPINVTAGTVIEISFWRVESPEKVWYEWCLESPMKCSIMNPNGRSYFIKKH